MPKNLIITTALVVAVAAILLCTGEISAAETGSSAFSSKEISSHADNVSGFLFGPIAKIAGILGGGYGLVSALLTSSIRPLVVFGGIGLGVALVPKFINSVFTLLIP